jgi:hypothetical protein
MHVGLVQAATRKRGVDSDAKLRWRSTHDLNWSFFMASIAKRECRWIRLRPRNQGLIHKKLRGAKTLMRNSNGLAPLIQ